MLIAEELFLLLTDDETGKQYATYGDHAVAAAALAELSNAGRVELDDKGTLLRVDLTRTGDLVLDTCLDRLRGAEGSDITALLRTLTPVVAEQVQDRLIDDGVLRREEKAVLGFIRSSRLMPADPGPEQAVRNHLGSVLAGSAKADTRSATLISLLAGSGVLGDVIDAEAIGLTKKELRDRAHQLAQGNAGAEALDASTRAINNLLFMTMTTTLIITPGLGES